jgi:hypothetical protein
VFVAIDHYFKWCEAWLIKEHDAYTIAKFWNMRLFVGMECLSTF